MTATSSATADGAGGRADGRALALPHDSGAEPDALDLAAVIALEEPARDGRLARGQRTRRAVAEALMELLRAGDPDPTAKAVAWRAGVSLRLVFHHFADMDDLYQFVATLQLRRQWADLPEISPGLSRATRIERTVAHRAAHFEEISAVRRALVCRAPTSPAVRQAIGAADALLLEDLKATFAPELAGLARLAPSTRADHVCAMDTCTSWETWERLRTAPGIPVRGARRVMSLMLTALCPAPGEGGPSGAAGGAAPTSSSSGQ